MREGRATLAGEIHGNTWKYMEIHRNIWLSHQNFFEPGYWGLEFGAWNLRPGIWSLEFI